MKEIITVETTVKSTIEIVWQAWTTPEHIVHWNFASHDWHCPKAVNNLTVGGEFSYRMEAVDGSVGFDFNGRYLEVSDREKILYAIEDGREVEIVFVAEGEVIHITESFEAEDIHTHDQQREGWQSILNNFKKHAETLTS